MIRSNKCRKRPLFFMHNSPLDGPPPLRFARPLRRMWASTSCKFSQKDFAFSNNNYFVICPDSPGTFEVKVFFIDVGFKELIDCHTRIWFAPNEIATFQELVNESQFFSTVRLKSLQKNNQIIIGYLVRLIRVSIPPP